VMAAAGFNFRKLMKKLKTSIIWQIFKIKTEVFYKIKFDLMLNVA
jgi:hypothetical protein